MMKVPMLKSRHPPRGGCVSLPVEITNSAGNRVGKPGHALAILAGGFGNAPWIGKILMLGMLVAGGPLYAEGGDKALFINVDGKVGIGTDKPKAQLDVQQGNRTGPPGAVEGLYVTGNLAPAKGVEFRHSNETQGIGIGYNTIYATGSDADQSLNMKPRGTGIVTVQGALTVQGRIRDKTGDVMPVGSIIAYAGRAAPEGWLFCNGAQIPEGEQYGELRVVLGVGTTPDLRGRTLVQAGQGNGLTPRELGQQGGEEKHTLTMDELAKHHHFGWGEASPNNWNEDKTSTELKTNKAGKHEFTGSNATDGDNYLYASTENGKGTPFNVMQPYHVVNYIIKY